MESRFLERRESFDHARLQPSKTNQSPRTQPVHPDLFFCKRATKFWLEERVKEGEEDGEGLFKLVVLDDGPCR